MKGEVTGYYVAVIPDEILKKSAGGIVLAEDYDPNFEARVFAASTTGTVISIGELAFKEFDSKNPKWKPWCKIGDRVHYQKHVAKTIEDKENLNKEGKPTMIFILSDQNIVWNEGQ